MERYKNLHGNSGVEAYEIRPHSIVVRFKDKWNYLYNDEKLGAEIIDKMKQLALQGAGLSTYISTNVKDNYAQKWPVK